MNKEEFSKLSDFDKIKHCVEESLKAIETRGFYLGD